MADPTLWGIHAGRGGDAHSLYMGKGVIALGWRKTGDLSLLTADRDSFKNAVTRTYPETKPGAIPVIGGQLFRFVHGIEVGDLVIYPSKRDRQIHIGRVESEYRYDNSGDGRYPNQRAVKWLQSFPRTSFSQGALYEIGSALSLFQVRNYADEFHAALEGLSRPTGFAGDETIGPVAEEIEETTRDFILKTLAREFKGHPLAYFVAHLLNTMGYHTRVSGEGPDGGIDIVAHRDELGFDPPLVKVQVKSTEGNVSDPAVSALYGKVESNEFGLLVTLGGFTAQAIAFASSRTNLRLIDGTELVDLIFAHYEQLDSRYKGLLPLKGVYVPERLAGEEI